MPKQAWNIFIGFLALLIIGFLGFNAWQYRQQLDKAKADLSAEKERAGQSLADGQSSSEKLKKDIATLEQNLKETIKMADELGAAKSALEGVNNRLSEENTNLRTKVQQAAASTGALEEDLKAKLASKDVTIDELKGKLSVNILNSVLFDLGKAELKDEGKQILQDVASVLEGVPDRPIHVIGHTDNIPFKGGGGRFRSNWELSAGRAVAAVQFLQTEAGIDPKRLAAVGHSEYYPLANNATQEGRAQNRRITLVIMPVELASALPPEPEPEPEPEPANTESGATASGVTNATPVLTPVTVNTNLTLPERTGSTNSAPELPKIPAPKARPESAAPPKG